jgi:hypothetical protein
MSRALFAACVAWALCAHARPAHDSAAAVAASHAAAATTRSRRPTLRPSNVLDEVKRYTARRPGLKAAALARHANALLARKGFDYDFDVCEIFPPEMLAGGTSGTSGATGALHTFQRRLTRLDGRVVIFHLVADDYGAPCGECYLTLPALRVTKTEMHLVAGGAVYALKRPASFALDEAHLVGADLKTVLRTWQLPYQTIPAGVSPDGKRLYVSFHSDAGLDELVLELSEDGRASFRAAEEAGARGGEWIEDHPKDPRDSDLSFMRFRVAGRDHVIRFTGPCT